MPRHAEPPPASAPPDISPPKTVAAGVPSVLSTTRRVVQETGLVKGVKALTRVNQADGFDCQGCAWPDPDADRHTAEFCEQGAKAVTDEATRARIDAAFFARWGVSALSQQTDRWLNQQGRLTEPMILRRGADHYTPISWDDAFAHIAAELQGLYTPDEAVFYTSGRTSNEAAFLFQLFARAFGTNNLPDCSNMCHESSGYGLKAVVGVGKGTVTLDDFDRADAIVILGQNPGTNHPRMLTSLERAKRRGCNIIAINPLPEAGLMRFKQPQDLKTPLGLTRNLFGKGTPISDLFLPVRVNGDVALLKGFAKALLEAEDAAPGTVLDRAFIAEKTTGFAAFEADIRAEGWSVIVAESGLTEEEIRAASAVLASSKRTIYCWAMGLTQHKNAVGNIQMVVNLALMQGNVGRPGAGLCPVRGHSNVQGDRTMGITPRPAAAFLDRLAAATGITPPRPPGLDTVDSIVAMHEGRARVFFALGGNFLSATPDTAFTAEALQRCRLTVQVSTKLNRAHLIAGEEALILPCLGRSEADVQGGKPQFVSVENSMGIVHASQGTFAPASPHLLSEPVIVARLAAATLGAASSIDWLHLASGYDAIRDCIEAVVPGCERYNERVRTPGGFYLPNAVREGRFNTPDGKGHFTVHPIPRHGLAEGQLLMMTIRSHDQFNTTIYSPNDRYRGIRGSRHVVFLHPDDMKARGLRKGDLVDLTSHFEGETRVARRYAAIPYPIPRGSAATYFPETNVLIPVRSTATGSNTPTSKSVVITLEPSTPEAAPTP